MKQLLSSNKLFIIAYLIFATALTIGLVTLNKVELHLFLNSIHNKGLDFLFVNTTKLAEEATFIFIAFLLLWKFGFGLTALVAQLGATTVTQIIKRTVNAPRPKKYFADNFPEISLSVPEGFRLYSAHSFPSGHTTAIFAIMVFLILSVKNNYLKLLFFIIALLTGYSRIYLSQHFALDVLVGSFIGSAGAFFAYAYIPQTKKWYNFSCIKSGLNLIKSKN